MNKIKVIGIGIIFLLIITTIPIVSSEVIEESDYSYMYKVSIFGRIKDVYDLSWGKTFTSVRVVGRIVQITDNSIHRSIFRSRGHPMYFSCDGEFKGVFTSNFICGVYIYEYHYPHSQAVFSFARYM